ncbi:MAG: SDR family oxidoreductase [Devosia sp.]|uniref:SDR family NAD(P)-dependent oxidoreductase n=1 Tax=Devosia sp. TaxID=1871048 RepID=UPI001AD3F9A2|nr:SDR family oxidoreductase [Devosia sp.]MBN9315657.1 SDR family oxidoreductase [Devosia sp.]
MSDIQAKFPSLMGQTVVVTGGASGIGEAFVRAFFAQGSRVTFLDIDAKAGSELASELNAAGDARALFLNCDVTDIPALRSCIRRSGEELGAATILINNAANDKREEFEEVTVEDFDWMMNVNVRHHLFAIQEVLPQMRKAGWGSIINMSSPTWVGGGPDMPNYSMAKAAVVGLTNSMANRLGGDSIRVNAILPGSVITERQLRLWHSQESFDEAVKRQAIHEQLLPKHVADLALFLAADESRLISKQMFFINGGS